MRGSKGDRFWGWEGDLVQNSFFWGRDEGREANRGEIGEEDDSSLRSE